MSKYFISVLSRRHFQEEIGIGEMAWGQEEGMTRDTNIHWNNKEEQTPTDVC